jgi:hypothetical protein
MRLIQAGTIPKNGEQKDCFVVPPRKDGKWNVIARYKAILNIESWNGVTSVGLPSQ